MRRLSTPLSAPVRLSLCSARILPALRQARALIRFPGSTQVLVNGTPVPLFYVSPAQINLQLPTGLSGDLSLAVVSGTGAGVNSRLTVLIQIFATGLGETNPPLPAGEAASIQPPYNVTVNPVTVWIDGQRADVQFSGVAPGVAGLFQLNAIVPWSGLQGNSVPLQIQVNGKQSNTVTLATKP